MPGPTLTWTISSDGLSIAKSADPFNMGPNGNAFQITVFNSDPTSTAHQLRIEKVHHKKKNLDIIPFTGPRKWLVLSGNSKTSTHVVKDLLNAPRGNYSYVLVLDGAPTRDPEIVVDPPDVHPKGRGRLRPTATVSARKGSKRSTQAREGAKRNATRKKTGKKKGAGKRR